MVEPHDLFLKVISVRRACNVERGKLDNDEHFIDDNAGTEGLNLHQADYQPEHKKNNYRESKENSKPTKSDPVFYPDNAQLTENAASGEYRDKTCVHNKDLTAKEKELDRGVKKIETNAVILEKTKLTGA